MRVKRMLETGAFLVLGMGIGYFVIAFILWDLKIWEWPVSARGLVLFIAGILIVLNSLPAKNFRK